MRLAPAGMSVTLALGLAATATLGYTSASQGPPSLLLYTGEPGGYLEPCGCSKPQVGGLPRRAAFLASLSRDPAPVIVENGDLVADPGRQSQIKAETLAGFYRQAGYAAVNLGEGDYRLGFGYLRALQAMAGTPFLSANVRLGNRAAFAETAAAANVILVGLIASSQAVEVRRWNPMLQVEEPDTTLARLEPSLKAAGRVILLFHGGPDEARPLARRYPWLSAIITAHEADDYRPTPLMEAGVPLVNAGRKGKVVGRLALRADGVQALPPISLGPEWTDDAAARDLLKRYLTRVNSEDLLKQVPRLPDADGRAFVGSASCQSCHATAHDVWNKSAHAHAFQTLVTAGHDRDPDCVGCHVVGLGTQGGFSSLAATPHLKDVGCEGCHGGGAAHAGAPAGHPMGRIAAAACASCHVAEHSPSFQFAPYWSKIRH